MSAEATTGPGTSAPLPALGKQPVPKEYAFISWETSGGRRACPLATFGPRTPCAYDGRLVCVEPPRADSDVLTNAAELEASIALVVRGGCSFAEKAKRIQAAGAKAMIVANNMREDPLAAFTMGGTEEDGLESITIPCVMLCLQDVRDLFKFIPPSVKDGQLRLEVLPMDEAHEVAQVCLREQIARQQAKSAAANATESNRLGWASIKRTTGSLLKRLEGPANLGEVSSVPNAQQHVADAAPPEPTSKQLQTTTVEHCQDFKEAMASPERKAPLFAFVQWSTSSDSYSMCYAPLSDFCLVANNAIYEGQLVPCDPLLANGPLSNGDSVAHNVALVQRGLCTFPAKLERIQCCGAIAAIVGNNDTDDPDAAFVMSVDQIKVDHVTIPAVMVSYNVFQRLLQEQPASVRILCFSGEAAANFLEQSADTVALMDVPEPTGDNDVAAAFHRACRDAQLEVVQQTLTQYCGTSLSQERQFVRQADHNLLTALHHACIGGNDKIVTLLLRAGALVTAQDVGMQTPLHYACLYGHADCVRQLLQASADSASSGVQLATMTNIGGSTPLHYACWSGSTDCIELLLTASARLAEDHTYVFDGVNATDNDGRTPLHVACRQALADCVMYLIAANAQVDTVDHSGIRPLQLACELVNDPTLSMQALHVVEKLMAAGADMRERAKVDTVAGSGASVPTSRQSHTLVLDRIESDELRRDLEIVYLRLEAHRSRASAEKLSHDLTEVNDRVQLLEMELLEAKQREAQSHHLQSEQARALQRQKQQLNQLQMQMSSILQYLHAPPGVASLGASRSENESARDGKDSSTSIAGRETSHQDEELALEAALARDLGRKFCRERRYDLAETYFVKSLTIFPLPGVQRMLEHAQELRQESEKRELELQREKKAHSTKQALLTQFREALGASNAPDSAMKSIESELSKLEGLEEGSDEYLLTQKWLEWLLSLPWSDPVASETDLGSAHSVSMGVFKRINKMELMNVEARRHRAAKVIQTAFREHYAVHLLRRAASAVRIQTVYRGWCARRRWQQLKLQLQTQRARGIQIQPMSPCLASSDDVANDKQQLQDDPLTVDYSQEVDSYALNRITSGGLLLLRGMLLVAPLGSSPRSSLCTRYCVLQLVRATSTFKWVASDTSYFVWHRWWSTDAAHGNCSALIGPYENFVTAQDRYERELKTRLAHSFQQVDALNKATPMSISEQQHRIAPAS